MRMFCYFYVKITCGFSMSFGVNKNFIPSMAPGNEIDLISRIPIAMYGNIARKYDAFPEDLIPEKYIEITFQSGNEV